MHCRKTKHPDLHKWFCVETIKVCCPKGTFGPDCNGNICSVIVAKKMKKKKKYCQETYDQVLVTDSSDFLHPSLCGGLRQTLSRKWNVRRRRYARREREVQLCPRLRGGVLSGLHRRLLQRSEERHLLAVHRCAETQPSLTFIVRMRSEVSSEDVASLISGFISSCRMPHFLQDLHWGNQSGLRRVQGRLGRGRPGNLCW